MSTSTSPRIKRVFLALGLILLTACAQPGPDEVTRDGIFDPYEARNRKVHERGKVFDTKVTRPIAVSYAQTVPEPAQDMVTNFAGNLSVPASVVNQVLQLDLVGALHNTVRFGMNTTLGFGGIFDVAREFGVYEDEADFGHTLAVWGVPEGAYLELPLVGPSTERDAFGKVVDLVIDPLNIIPRPESFLLTGSRVVARVGKRGRYVNSVDGVLYESADSYAQMRLLYLQNRRYEVGQSGPAATSDGEIDPYAKSNDDVIDPYEELYGVQ